MKTSIPLLLSLLAMSCSTAKLSVPEQFAAASDQMTIKGVNGFVLNQKLRFGNYATSKVKRGWTVSTEANYYTVEQRLMQVFNLDNFHSVSEQRNRYRYFINDGGLLEAQVFCQEQMSREEIKIRTNTRLLGDLARTQRSNYSFCAAILPTGDSSQPDWQLLMYQTYDRKKDTARRWFDLPFQEEEGYATNGEETITIRPLRLSKMTSKNGKESNFPVKMLSGYELKIDDGVIAVIDSLASRLYIYKELDAPTRLIVAAICSALLLRQLEDNSA